MKKKDKILLITGGTGSFGNAVLERFLKSDFAKIRIFSRDEKKQDAMRLRLNNPKLEFCIGDVRDFECVRSITRDVNYIFHAAALKQVPSCEFFPMEAYKTNVVGTFNVLEAAIQNNVEKVVCLSTDKSVYPINAMGISKAMMEKVMIAKSIGHDVANTVVCGTRYGNVMASRGSVIPLFVNQILLGRPVTITDPRMTRFMMTLDDAVDLVCYAFEHGSKGEIFVQKAPATTMNVLAESIKKIMGVPHYPTEIIGTRHGEKLFESLLSREEAARAIDLGNYFCIPPDRRDLRYEKFVEEGEKKISEASDYNSHNTHRLDIEETVCLLRKVRFIQRLECGEHIQPE